MRKKALVATFIGHQEDRAHIRYVSSGAIGHLSLGKGRRNTVSFTKTCNLFIMLEACTNNLFKIYFSHNLLGSISSDSTGCKSNAHIMGNRGNLCKWVVRVDEFLGQFDR